MPYQPHMKMTMSGSFRNSTGVQVEIFSMSMNFGIQGDGQEWIDFLQEDTDAIAAAAPVQNAISTWFSSADTRLSSSVTLDLVKFAAITTTGKYSGNASLWEPSGVAGANSSRLHPTTTSYVVSLRTGQRGPKGRGRFYAPGPAIPIGLDWRFDTSDIPVAANAAETMIAALQTAIGNAVKSSNAAVVKLVVASKSNNSYPVTTVEIDAIPANVSRRKNQLAETFFVGS